MSGDLLFGGFLLVFKDVKIRAIITLTTNDKYAFFVSWIIYKKVREMVGCSWVSIIFIDLHFDFVLQAFESGECTL